MKNKTLVNFLILLFCFSASLTAKNHYKYDVAICAIFQNEAPYLKEWIEFHQLVGVKHFYLFNNLSEDDYKEVLAPYIASGLVKLIDWPYISTHNKNWNLRQLEAYDYALKIAKKEAKWLAIIDSDEFLFPVEANTLTEFLADYEDVAGISVNWQLFGTSGVEKIEQDQLLIEELIYKAPFEYSQNAHVKAIVQTKRVERMRNPHFALFKSGFYSVNSNKEKIAGAISPYVLIDKIRINHYWSRDEEFFRTVKLPRVQKWGFFDSNERLNEINREEDFAIQKYLPKLKRAMLNTFL